ncbi:MAG: SLC13 family permease [Polyangiaceae bacterium]|nr:SLC13 family permease [Polyangiaceae bacterium]
MSAHIAVALSIFALTLAAILVRPRGWHEGMWATLGAATAGAFGLVRLRDVGDVVAIAREPLLFLLGLLVLSKLVERSGFFDWAAAYAARFARGRGDVLFRNFFILGALSTVTLSLDTTALLVTPLVVACVRRLGLPGRPYVLACVFVANGASLLLPISNLTNLLFASRFGFTFATYAVRMVGPQAAALAVTYVLLSRAVRSDLGPFDPACCGDPAAAVPHRAYFRASSIVLATTLVAYFLAPLAAVPPYAVTFAACAVLAIASRGSGQVTFGVVRSVAWGVFPFVIGLFVVVRGLENAGATRAAVTALSHLPEDRWQRALWLSGATGLASNMANNLPAALFARGALGAVNAGPADVAAALVGLDVGPNVFIFASLATMLVLDVASAAGAPLRGGDLARVGLRVTPAAVAAAATAVALQALIVR